MKLNKYYGHFLLLMIIVLILIMMFAYTHSVELAEHSNRRRENEKFLLSSKPDNMPIEKIVEHILYGLYEAALVPINSNPDEYTKYNIWYSYMNRRGVPEAYITHDIYKQLHDKPVKVAPTEIEKIIRPIYEREQYVAKPKPFQPVCLNY